MTIKGNPDESIFDPAVWSMIRRMDEVETIEQLSRYCIPHEVRHALSGYSKDTLLLKSEVITSGCSGGSYCSDPDYFTNSDMDVSFPELKKFLLFFAPSLPFSEYVKLEENIVRGEFCVSGYYGNYDNILLILLPLPEIECAIKPYLREGITAQEIKAHFEVELWEKY